MNGFYDSKNVRVFFCLPQLLQLNLQDEWCHYKRFTAWITIKCQHNVIVMGNSTDDTNEVTSRRAFGGNCLFVVLEIFNRYLNSGNASKFLAYKHYKNTGWCTCAHIMHDHIDKTSVSISCSTPSFQLHIKKCFWWFFFSCLINTWLFFTMQSIFSPVDLGLLSKKRWVKSDLYVNARMWTEMDLNESEVDLNESEVDLKESEIDLSEWEHFLKVNLNLSIIS